MPGAMYRNGLATRMRSTIERILKLHRFISLVRRLWKWIADEVVGRQYCQHPAEDESSIRRLIVTRLRTEGYRVLEAADGQEALMLTELREEAVDLLISDVVMPRRSGTSLARELRTRQPDLPLIFISGFVGNAQLNLARDFPGAAFMQKPLRFDELIDAVKRLLEPESAEPDADQTAREAARES